MVRKATLVVMNVTDFLLCFARAPAGPPAKKIILTDTVDQISLCDVCNALMRWKYFAYAQS